jgi:hypothetical protein
MGLVWSKSSFYATRYISVGNQIFLNDHSGIKVKRYKPVMEIE